MNRDDIQKLLGGYATGTLTGEEQQVLFEAALDDQELFDALAREQALRDLLRDPGSKAELLAALDRRPPRWYERFVPTWRPLVAAGAMAGVSALAVLVWQGSRSPKPVLIARADLPSKALSEPPRAQAADKDSAPPAPVPAVPEGRANTAPAAKERQFSRQAAKPAEHEEDRNVKAKERTAPPPPPAEPTSAFKKDEALREPSLVSGFREGARVPGGIPGGVVGGVIGGVPGTTPAAQPPPQPIVQAAPAPPKVLASAPRQEVGIAQSETKQSQYPGGPLQSPSQATQAAVSQADQIRLQKPASPGAPDNSPAKSASVDAMAVDARSMYYGAATAAQAAGGRGGSGFASAARKRAADQPAPAQSNAAAVSGRALEAMLSPNVGVKYSLLRKNASGAVEKVNPENLKKGDAVQVELQSNASGLLTVQARRDQGPWRPIATTSVNSLQTYTTTPLLPGENELQILLTPEVRALTGVSLRDDKAGTPFTSRSAAEEATYVVTPGARQLDFMIKLNYK